MALDHSLLAPAFKPDLPGRFPLAGAQGFFDLPAHEVVAVGVAPDEEVLLGETAEQVAHRHAFQLVPLGHRPRVELDHHQHHHDQRAEGGVDDEGGDEEPVHHQEGVVRAVVVGRVDRLDDRQQRRARQDADRHLEDAPGRRGRDHRPHGVDETDVGGDYQRGRTDLLPAHLVARGRRAVEELDQSEEGEEEDGNAELDNGAQGGLQHGDAHNSVAVGVFKRAVFCPKEVGVLLVVGVAVVCKLIVVEDLFAAEEAVLEAFVGVGGVDAVLLLAGVVDLDVVLDEVVVAELGGLGAQGEGDLDAAEVGVVLVALETLLQDLLGQLLPVVLVHVEVLHRRPQVRVPHAAHPQLTGPRLGHFDVHAVESQDQLNVGPQGHLDGVERGHQVEVVLLQREEEDVGTQPELELAGDDEIAVEATRAGEVVLAEVVADGAVAVRNVSAQILLDVQDEVVLEGDLQLLPQQFCDYLCELLGACAFVGVGDCVCGWVARGVPRWKEMFMVATKRQERFWMSISVMLRKWQRTQAGMKAVTFSPSFNTTSEFSQKRSVHSPPGPTSSNVALSTQSMNRWYFSSRSRYRYCCLRSFSSACLSMGFIIQQLIMMMLASLKTFARLYFSPFAALANAKIRPGIPKKPLAQSAGGARQAGSKGDWVREGKKQKEQVSAGREQQKVQANWKKYGREVADVLQTKKTLIDIDLAFLAGKIAHNELPVNEQLSLALKGHIKALKEANFSLLPQLVELAFLVGLVAPPQLFLQSYLDHYRHNTFTIEENQALGFPTYFLKRVGLQVFLLTAERNLEEGAVALRFFGSILSLNELKRADEFCTTRLPSMKTEEVSRLFTIFRQLKKRGSFVELAEGVLIQKQAQLCNRSIIATAVSFLELGSRESLEQIEQSLVGRVEGGFAIGEVVSLLHVLHKYKAGGVLIWQAIEKQLLVRHKAIPFEHLFLLMSGLARNYAINPHYLEQLILADPSLAYAAQLKEKQYVEFFFVVYAHYYSLAGPLKQKYSPLLVTAVKSADLRSVYSEIQAFFLFLLEGSPERKKEELRRAYPDDTLLGLLACEHNFENTDVREQEAYEQELKSRCGDEIWKRHRGVLVAEEFIRYKLVSALQERPAA